MQVVRDLAEKTAVPLVAPPLEPVHPAPRPHAGLLGSLSNVRCAAHSGLHVHCWYSEPCMPAASNHKDACQVQRVGTQQNFLGSSRSFGFYLQGWRKPTAVEHNGGGLQSIIIAPAEPAEAPAAPAALAGPTVPPAASFTLAPRVPRVAHPPPAPTAPAAVHPPTAPPVAAAVAGTAAPAAAPAAGHAAPVPAAVLPAAAPTAAPPGPGPAAALPAAGPAAAPPGPGPAAGLPAAGPPAPPVGCPANFSASATTQSPLMLHCWTCLAELQGTCMLSHGWPCGAHAVLTAHLQPC